MTMWKLGIWDGHEGDFVATIEGNGNIYEAVVGWLVDEEEAARFWRLVGAARLQGWPVVKGYDEVVTVYRLDVGVD